MSSFPPYSSHRYLKPPPVVDTGGYPFPPHAPVLLPKPQFQPKNVLLSNQSGTWRVSLNCNAQLIMARNFGHARAVNIQTWENLKQYGYTKL